MKSNKDWWKVGDTPDQVDMALRRAQAKKSELERMRLFQRTEPAPIQVTTLEDFPQYVRPGELAPKLRKSAETILRDIRRGALKARADGRSYLIDLKDVPDYMKFLELETQHRAKKRSA